MELRQLEAFVAVATELHFGRAARKLHMGQPTVSDLIRRLEREMGAQLMTRTTRRVALTSAGSELLGRAKVILDEVGSACAAVHRLSKGQAGTVRLGITPRLRRYWRPTSPRHWRRRHRTSTWLLDGCGYQTLGER